MQRFMSRWQPPVKRWGFWAGGAGAAIIATVLTVVLTGGSAADITAPRASDRQVSLVVTQVIQDEHLRRDAQPIDDKVSQRTFDAYFKTLDPLKLYFEKRDIDTFMPFRDRLDDMIKKGDLSFGFSVFKVYLERVDQRVKTAVDLAVAKHDFSIDEDVMTDGDKLPWAANTEEINDRWRKRIKLELLQLKADHIEKEEEKKTKKDEKPGDKPVEGKADDKKDEPYDEAKARERIQRRYASLGKRLHQTKDDDLLEMYLTAFTTSLDPHTSYMSPTSLKQFRIIMGKELQGIGAALQVEDGYTTIQRVVPGGPADKDGRLKPTDRVVAVGQGESGEMVDTIDMRLSDVVDMIRGDQGTVVRLEVMPGGTGQRQIYKITRAKIELTDSIARSEIVEAGKKADGKPYKIGVIDLPDFYMDMEGARRRLPDYRSTTRDVAKILTEYNAKGVDAVVLDLRRNGGGSLKESVDLTGLFIDKGPVVLVKDHMGNVDHHDDPLPGMKWRGPLVVMTSKFSASASEIFAGAIQDYRRGIIVGDHSTHGKGTVQSLLEVGERLFQGMPRYPNLGALKITIQQFYRPSGESTQQRGVLADVELPSITTHLDVGEGDLDYSLPFDKIAPLAYSRDDVFGMPVLAELKTRSQKRVTNSADFGRVDRRIKRYLERKEKPVPLNEAKYLAWRSELNTDKELEETFREEPTKPVIRKDYYFKEVVDITLDYMQLMAGQGAVDRIGQSK